MDSAEGEKDWELVCEESQKELRSKEVACWQSHSEVAVMAWPKAEGMAWASLGLHTEEVAASDLEKSATVDLHVPRPSGAVVLRSLNVSDRQDELSDALTRLVMAR